MEMRGRWDHFDGAQEQIEKTQAQRHQENQEKLDHAQKTINTVAVIASLALLVVTALGVYVAYKESLHSKAIISAQPTVAERQSASDPPMEYHPQ